MLQLPSSFIEQTKELLPSEWEAFEKALQSDSPVSIRLNNKLQTELPYDNIPWCSSGYYLPSRPIFTLDPLFHAGAYYVQEAGSMFLEQIIKQYIDTPVYALDLCAAPGGKATHISNLLPQGSFLIANELIRSRSNILAENMQKWGNPDVAVTNNNAADLGRLTATFDLIVADVPCSGEGMFRKDPDSINEWSPANVELCANRQRDIMRDIWPALKEGGILIYSTCTYNNDEDEANVNYIASELGAELLPVKTKPEWNITESNSFYRFFPHKTRSEGFFIAALRKTASESHSKSRKSTNKSKIKADHLKPLLLQTRNWKFGMHKNTIVAYDEQFEELITRINQYLSPLITGISLGEEKGKDFIPGQALALSKELNISNSSTKEISTEDALMYLKRETILLPDSPKGYILLTYSNLPLGWVKNLGSRANNLYPQEWRIRMNIHSIDNSKKIDFLSSL